MWRVMLGIWLALSANVLWAQDDVAQTFLEWVERRDMAPAVLVVLDRDGTVLHSAEQGADLQTPMPIASISKTIAGHCTVYAARQGRIDLDAPIGPHLGWTGVQGDVTFSQLLTHTSGFGPDETQLDITGMAVRMPDRIAALIDRIKDRPLADKSGAYSYNNENYLVLEAALSAALGEDALTWCTRSVPALAALPSVGVAPSTRAIGMAGGLQISTGDLAQFFAGLPETPPVDWPLVPLSGANAYGPGIIVQDIGAGHNLFHVGGFCTLFGPDLGAFAVRLASGQTLVMTYSDCANDEDIALLNGLALEFLAAP